MSSFQQLNFPDPLNVTPLQLKTIAESLQDFTIQVVQERHTKTAQNRPGIGWQHAWYCTDWDCMRQLAVAAQATRLEQLMLICKCFQLA